MTIHLVDLFVTVVVAALVSITCSGIMELYYARRSENHVTDTIFTDEPLNKVCPECGQLRPSSMDKCPDDGMLLRVL